MKRIKVKKHIIGRAVSVICLFILMAASVCLLSSCNFKTNPYLNNLDIDIALHSDGSARITETHVVVFGARDDDWWNYYKTISLVDLGGSHGVTRSDFEDFVCTVDGKDYPVEYNSYNMDYISSAQKNQMRGSAYTYFKSSSKLEIGVVMPDFYRGTRTITFSYTLTNLMTGYADRAGLYYKFVDETNTLSIKNLNAKVTFPSVDKLEDIAVWTHIDDGNGSGIIQAADTVVYQAEELPEEKYFETRLLLPKDGYELKKTNNATFSDINAEESKWQEDFRREAQRAKNFRIADYVLAALTVVLSVIILIFIYIKRKPRPDPDAPIYIREIPTGWTAGEMAPVYHYYGKYEVSDAMSATILDLCRRHYIDIKPGDKKKSAEILVNNYDISDLKPHERIVYELLYKCGGNAAFTMKYFESFAEKNSAYFGKKIEEFKNATYGMSQGMGITPKNKLDKFGKIASGLSKFACCVGIILLVATVILSFIGFFMVFTALALILSGVATLILTRKQKPPLSENGQKTYDKFRALGRFMTDFSNMDKHELPQLILWEEYMVYATAMGIADKVAEQLEIAYPEYKEMVSNGYYRRDNTFLILYLLSPSLRFSTNFALAATINGITKSVARINLNNKLAKSAGKISKGIGGGGGFRGGGGGFGGGGMGAR